VAVFNARAVTAQKTRPLFDVALRELLFYPQFAQAVTDNHRCLRSDAQGKAEVKEFGLHGLRHLYSSLLGESGAPVKHAQQRLGHASATTTLEIYTHSLTEDGQKYAKRVEDAFPFVSNLLAEEAESGQEPKVLQ